MSLVTNTIFKSDYLETTEATKDDEMDRILARAQDLLDSFLLRILEEATYTDEKHSGDGRTIFFHVKHRPIQTTPAPVLVISDTTYVLANEDFYVWYDEGMIELTTAIPKGWQNIVITYKAGYSTSTLPKVLEDAIYRIAQHIWQQGNLGDKRQGLKSRAAGQGGGISFMDNIFIKEEIAAISIYRDIRL